MAYIRMSYNAYRAGDCFRLCGHFVYTILTGPWTEPVSSWDLTTHKYTQLTYTERKKFVLMSLKASLLTR